MASSTHPSAKGVAAHGDAPPKLRSVHTSRATTVPSRIVWGRLWLCG